MRILLADDDQDWRKLLSHYLADWEHDVVLAEDGDTAWAILQQDLAPRVAILDWQMPGLDGIEICRRLKSDPSRPFTYTILLTGREAREDQLTGFEAGADDYLTKPVDTEILRRRLIVASRIVDAVPPSGWVAPQVPGYTVERLLGKGSAGSVWKAVQNESKRTVALKIIRTDLVTEEVYTRFAAEVQIMKRLSHPNIARIFDSKIEPTSCYYAMELIEGPSLGRFVEDGAPHRDILKVMVDVCSAIDCAHANGVVHRDLKSANILLTANHEPKVVDFGLSKSLFREEAAVDETVTLHGILLGTPLYMAPEQAKGQNDAVDARTDVYALGVLLYIALLKRHPVALDRTSHLELMRSLSYGEARRPSIFQPDFDPELERILMKALAQAPDQRYSRAGPLGADLASYLEGS